MTFKTIARFCAVASMAWVVVIHLGPANWRPSTGLGWTTEHFLGYFVVTSIVCLAWPRPFVVGGALMVASALLEVLQFFTPDRTPDLATVIFGAGGALAAALIAELFIRIRSGLRAKREQTR
jgi:VanZ family protein